MNDIQAWRDSYKDYAEDEPNPWSDFRIHKITCPNCGKELEDLEIKRVTEFCIDGETEERRPLGDYKVTMTFEYVCNECRCRTSYQICGVLLKMKREEEHDSY